MQDLNSIFLNAMAVAKTAYDKSFKYKAPIDDKQDKEDEAATALFNTDVSRYKDARDRLLAQPSPEELGLNPEDAEAPDEDITDKLTQALNHPQLQKALGKADAEVEGLIEAVNNGEITQDDAEKYLMSRLNNEELA